MKKIFVFIFGLTVLSSNICGESSCAEENHQIRESIHKMLNSLKKTPSNKPECVSILPNKQLLPVKTPLSILDGKTTVIIKEIYESGRKPKARVIIEVPKRKPYKKAMYDSDSMLFEYFQKEYKLTITNIDLDRQQAKVTIIQM